jgi:REP element-mobilizing transposase RayT
MNFDNLQFFNPYGAIRETENRLPHWQQQGAVYFVTFHLGDALPASLLAQWHAEREAWLRHHPQPWTAEVEHEYHERFSAATEQWLDAGHGSCLLRRPECARCVGDALAFFEGQRCSQIAWIVMPNHVHAVFVLHPDWKLEQLLHSWKRYSAREINKLEGREGGLWQRDYFDRLVRDAKHFANCVRYIWHNPEKAKLRPNEYLHYENDIAKSIE